MANKHHEKVTHMKMSAQGVTETRYFFLLPIPLCPEFICDEYFYDERNLLPLYFLITNNGARGLFVTKCDRMLIVSVREHCVTKTASRDPCSSVVYGSCKSAAFIILFYSLLFFLPAIKLGDCLFTLTHIVLGMCFKQTLKMDLSVSNTHLATFY